MENEETKAKNNYKSIRKNYKTDHEGIIEIFLKMRKLRWEIILALEIKICQMKIDKEKKNLSEIIAVKEKCIKSFN